MAESVSKKFIVVLTVAVLTDARTRNGNCSIPRSKSCDCMFKKLTTPKFPAASISFPDHAITMLEITKRRGSFALKHYATTQTSENVLAPSFDSPNILDE